MKEMKMKEMKMKEMKMKDDKCLFCKIVSGVIPAEKIFENEYVLGFKDLHPLAKIHHLFIHKEHVGSNLNEMMDHGPQQVQQIFHAINEFTKENKLVLPGYRVVVNTNNHGGQTIFHPHFHLLGGEQLKGFGS